MTKIFNDIKSAYENKVLGDFFTVKYVTDKGTYKLVFANDWGRWRFAVDNDDMMGPYIYSSDWVSDGKKLTDNDIKVAAYTIESLNL